MLTILLVWVVPILWGALIGYFTNALAIRMLFRPLTRKYLLGVPVPLTPGIIPRRRGELARSIGRMVARDLLSPEAVRARLQSETFRAALEAQFRHLRESLLRRPLAEFAAHARSALHGTDGGEFSWPELVRHLLQRVLVRLIGSRAFIYGVRSLVQRLVDDFAARRLHELIGLEQLTALVTGSLLPALDRDEIRAQIAGLVKNWLQRQRAANVPLDRFLTPETMELLAGMFRRNLPALLEVLFTWLRGPQVRRELEVYGRAILRDILDKLNLMQKVFITAGQYDRSLSERMPEIVTDVIDQAEAATAGAAVREQICGGRGAPWRSGASRVWATWRLTPRPGSTSWWTTWWRACSMRSPAAMWRGLPRRPRRRCGAGTRTMATLPWGSWRRAISACSRGRLPTSWPTSSSGIWRARKPGNESPS